MNLEDIARRFSKKTGFSLISYQQVALPIFRLNLRILTIARKKLPPISEFILKAINAGINIPNEIAAFLGLELAIINGGIISLIQSDDIIVGASDGTRTHCLMLTAKGKETLKDLTLTTPEDIQMKIDFDGLTHKLSQVNVNAIKPIEVRDAGIHEISSFPRRKPRIDELKIDELRPVVKEYFSKGAFIDDRSLLAILEIERVERLFRDDVIALVFKAIERKEVQVDFIIDNHISEEHAIAFQQVDKSSQVSLISQQIEESIEDIKQNISEEIIKMTAPLEKTSRIKNEVDSATREVRDLTQRLTTSESISERGALEQQLREAQEKLAQMNAAMNSMVVRPVEVFEHPLYLKDAIRSSEERLMIISPWIRAKVVNDDFVNSLENTLKRGVNIFIGYGLGEENQKVTDADQHAVLKLKNLGKEYNNFHLEYFGDTHAKVLACDKKFTIVTSFNWLSFLGDPQKSFRDERGYYIAIPEEVDKQFDFYKNRFI